MNTKRWILTICTAALLSAPRPAISGPLIKAPHGGIPDRYLVVLDPSAVRQAVAASATNRATATRRLADAITQTAGVRPAAVYGNVQQFLIAVPEPVAERLAQDPRVLFVEQDAKIFLSAPSCYDHTTSSFPPANSYDPTSPQTISCWDPQLSCSDNWGLDRIDQRTGSESAHTLDGKFYFTANGQGTHIYILDTGIATGHTEFALPGGGSRIGNGASFVPGSPSWDTWDYLGHGTHVASIAAGRRFGVAKAATVHPVRVFDQNGGGTVSTVVSGINWIIGNVQRPAVVNMSFNYNRAGFDDTTALDSAVHQMVATYGIPGVNSAGNWNQDAYSFSPTDLPEVIVAAGLDWFNNQRWGADPNFGCHDNGCGSNWGAAVDLYAPATDVLAALASGERNLACDLTGTSMAAPHVSGVVAQYLQTHPTATPAQIESALIANATLNVITGNLGGSPNRLLYTNY
jgi:subtilisin family serine protease